MIVNPYTETICLHDMTIESIEIEGSVAYIKLDQAFLLSGKDDYILDNPLIIINDIIDIETNRDYPIRIRLFNDEEVIIPHLSDFNEFTFNILEEAYGFGLVHFYGSASKVNNDEIFTYDSMIDIHYSGDLEIKWDDKCLIGA